MIEPERDQQDCLSLGKLAGYGISHMPIACIWRGQLLGWLPETLRELVPNV